MAQKSPSSGLEAPLPPIALFPRPLSASMRSERFEAALATRHWGVPANDPRNHAILLLAGSGKVKTLDAHLELSAPCIVWLPVSTALSIEVTAGAAGHMASSSEQFLARCIAESSNALNLRQTADRIVSVELETGKNRIDSVRTSFAAIETEIREPQPGALSLLSAHLGLILLHLWRLSGLADTTFNRQKGSVTLQRFRQLLELHFRDHWQLSDYSRALGVTADQLHEACRRDTGTGALAMIQERLINEAKTRLVQSPLPVEQIAFALGFKDPGYFNRFFRSKTGHPPGAWRREALQAAMAAMPTEPGFADWP